MQQLARDGGQWWGAVEVPGEGGATLTVRALGADAQELASREVALAAHAEGRVPALLLALEIGRTSLTASPTRSRVLAVRASTLEAYQGEPVALEVVTTPGLSGGPPPVVSYAASAGRLQLTGDEGARWYPPQETGAATLTLALFGPDGSANRMSFVLWGKGSKSKETKPAKAKVRVTFNTWPVVQWVAAKAGRLLPGQTTQVSVNATDPDKSPLKYQWSDACGGAFSATALANTAWTAPNISPAGGACTLKVTVQDKDGGSTQGELTLHIGPPPALNEAPQVQSTFTSSPAPAAGEQVTLRVTATDREGHAIAVSWSASAGIMLGYGTTTGPAVTTGELLWIAPAGGTTALVTATLTDAGGARSDHTFTLTSHL